MIFVSCNKFFIFENRSNFGGQIVEYYPTYTDLVVLLLVARILSRALSTTCNFFVFRNSYISEIKNLSHETNIMFNIKKSFNIKVEI